MELLFLPLYPFLGEEGKSYPAKVSKDEQLQ